MWGLLFESGYHSVIGLAVFAVEILSGAYATYEWFMLANSYHNIANGNYARI